MNLPCGNLIRRTAAILCCYSFILKYFIMANQGNQGGKSDRGLASADKETRERVAREGGKASGGRGNSGGKSSSEKERGGREGGKGAEGGR